jgi:uncharacterized protein with NRDE domain
MCTIGILHRADPELPLVVIANRDEFYARPARRPEVLDAQVGAAGGVDAQSGGTWLGVTRHGRIVAVTNQRAAAPPAPGVRSRGHAVRGALAAADLDAYVRALDPREFSSMNLVYGDARELRVAYFRQDTATVDIDALPHGVHVICNDRIDAPGFPRGQRLAGVLRANAGAPWAVMRARLAAALGDHARVAIAETETYPEPITRELAEAMTSICIHSPLYGTRSSAIVAVGVDRVHQYLHAEGPPCTAPFADYTELVR